MAGVNMQSFILKMIFLCNLFFMRSWKRIKTGRNSAGWQRGFACRGGHPQASFSRLCGQYRIFFFEEEENGLLLFTLPRGFGVTRRQETATLQWRLMPWNRIGWDVLHGGWSSLLLCAHLLRVLTGSWFTEFKSSLKGHMTQTVTSYYEFKHV